MVQRTSVSTLLRRALPQRSSNLSPQMLLRAAAPSVSASNAPAALATFTCQQQFLQEIHDAEETYRTPSPLDSSRESGRKNVPHTCGVDGAVEVDRLLAELLELHEAISNNDCISSTERRYLSLLRQDVVSFLTRAVCATVNEPHGSGNVKETCRPLLTLCVKPTSLTREIAFSLMHSVVVNVTIQAPRIVSQQAKEGKAMDELFACVNDMVIKSVGVASSSITSPDGAWIRNAAACLLTLVRSSSNGYRSDRLVRLDPSTLVLLVRQAFSLTTASANETEAQDALEEMLVSAMYAHRSRSNGRSATDSLSLAEIERFGGVELLLAILYGAASDSMRRLVLVVMFDLVVDQVKRGKSRDDDKDTSVSYESLLRCLQECEFATLVATTPLCFVTHAAPTTTRVVKTLHAKVENELLENHVSLVWSALRSLLHVDEYFARSASLAHAMKLLTNQPPQLTHDSVAEMIAAKAHQLTMAPRLEDRFKGERWLAELLCHGLRVEIGTINRDNNIDYGTTLEQQFLLAEGPPASDDQLEESLCYDEGAEIRLAARATLWELSRSPSVTSRLAFAHVISLFTRRRVWSGAPPIVLRSHIRELNTCLDALVAQQEGSAAVIVSVLQTLLQVVAVISSEVPYLDLHRQRYDAESSDAPQQLVGSLVGSESLAAKILRGTVSVDRSYVAEISLAFLLHALDVLDAAMPTLAGSDRHAPCLMADYAAVTALLISYALEDKPTQHNTLNSLAPFLNSHDTRIAVLAARAIVAQLKRDCGDQRYADIVRQIHATAVDSDDEAPLANSVAHARAVLRYVVTDPLAR